MSRHIFPPSFSGTPPDPLKPIQFLQRNERRNAVVNRGRSRLRTVDDLTALFDVDLGIIQIFRANLLYLFLSSFFHIHKARNVQIKQLKNILYYFDLFERYVYFEKNGISRFLKWKAHLLIQDIGDDGWITGADLGVADEISSVVIGRLELGVHLIGLLEFGSLLRPDLKILG